MGTSSEGATLVVTSIMGLHPDACVASCCLFAVARGEGWGVKASARGHLVHVPALSICWHAPRVAHWGTAACLANSR